MAVHTFKPRLYHNTLGTHQPVLRVAPGDRIKTTTVDAHGGDATGRQITPTGNPQTGPFYVEGAGPGDTLVVRLDRLTPNRKTGWTRTSVAPNVLDPDYAATEWPTDAEVEWRIDTKSGTARLVDPPKGLEDLQLPLTPMIGCFGVAPAGEQAISTSTSGPHGGNMDYREFVEGTTVYFPIEAEGGLFFVGDGHALQGDGEIVGTGIETSFDVEFTLSLIPERKIIWPRGHNKTHIFTAGNARPLDQATQHATTEMIRWLGEMGLDSAAAHLLMGQCVRYQLGNMYDPAYTMVCLMEKATLSGLGLTVEDPMATPG